MLAPHSDDFTDRETSLSSRLASLTFDEDILKRPRSHSPSPSRVGAAVERIIDSASKLIERVAPSLANTRNIMDAFDSLSNVIQDHITNVAKNPEIAATAVLSRDNKITNDELEFQNRRKAFMKKAFAKFIGVPENLIELEDIPIIAVAGSGGGYKAMIATSGFMKAMQEDGLFDCVMYLSGVSGSCWTMSNFYTAAKCSPAGLVEHFKQILSSHPADPFHILNVLGVNPDERIPALFGGMEQKRFQGLNRGLVDTYGALMMSHFMSGEGLDWEYKNFKLSQHMRWVSEGQNPLPLYTAIRHERPWKDRKPSGTSPTSSPSSTTKSDRQTEYEKGVESEDLVGKFDSVQNGESWWQWHEFSPFQTGSDELRAWVPTWSFGRRFEGGKTVDNMPEQSFSLQVGLFASAMCAPFEVSVETFDRSKASSSFGVALRRTVRKLIEPNAPVAIRQLLASHPVHASFNWNPLYLLDSETSTPGLTNSPRIQLIDAGADNNLPLYPMVREGRGVDIIFAFDSSEDVESNIVTPDIDSFGAKKGIKFTLTSPAPPPQAPEVFGKDAEAAAASLPPLLERYAHRYCQIYDGKAQGGGFGIHGEPLADHDVTLIYMPVLPNVGMPGYEPGSNTFAKLQYTAQEVSDLAQCAALNWKQEVVLVRDTVRAVWEKKRAARLAARGA